MIGRAALSGASAAGLLLRSANVNTLSHGPLFVTIQQLAADCALKPTRRPKLFSVLVAEFGTAGRKPVYQRASANTDRMDRAAGEQMNGGRLCG